MFCPRCATENQPEQKYCRRCGQPLAGVHLALEGRVDEAIKTLRIGEKRPRILFVLLAAALLLLTITTISALRTGAPLAFLLMPALGPAARIAHWSLEARFQALACEASAQCGS